MPEEDPPDAEQLLGDEGYDWGAVPNLDAFFTRLYRCGAGCRPQQGRVVPGKRMPDRCP